METMKLKIWDSHRKIMFEPKVIDIFLDCEGNVYQQVYSEDEMSIKHLKQLNSQKHIKRLYTGLRDHLKTEIYSGDIVKIYFDGEPENGVSSYQKVCVVGWNYEAAGFEVRDFNGRTEDFEKCITEDFFEVIGNIYENPGLFQAMNAQ